MREREQKKKADEAEFDRLRALLGPKLKEWSEQYGKKKDIRALLVRRAAPEPRSRSILEARRGFLSRMAGGHAQRHLGGLGLEAGLTRGPARAQESQAAVPQGLRQGTAMGTAFLLLHVDLHFRPRSFCPQVHPDRTVRLSIEKRFVGQRIFDALSQAFSEFEANGMR